MKNSVLRKKHLSVDFPYNFIQSTFNSHQQKCESLIPNWLFEEKHRKTIYIRIPFSQLNEHYVLKFIRKLEGFTKEKHFFVIIWKTRNIRSLFNLKDKTSHVSPVVYEGKCNCGENYIGDTWRNATISWNEHSNIGKNSEPAKHLNQFPEHRLNWKILRKVPNKVWERKIHEAYSQQTLNVDSTLIYVEITSRCRSAWYPRWFNDDLSTLIHR